jgi:stage V sporulation protein D (sporulation-specific penicillin-binding protein)
LTRRSGNVTWRLWAVVGAIACGTLIITARLAQLQIVDHEQYAQEARLMHLSQQTVFDRRGALLDRNGYPLAASEDAFDVMVERGVWAGDQASAGKAAQAISEITGVPPEQMLSAVSGAEVFEAPAAKGLNYEKAAAVRQLGLRGVRLADSSRRVYPEGNMAAQLVGFVGRDNVGLTGLEADLDSVLGGTRGTLTFERDALGNQLAIGERRETPAQPGANVVLTIDRYIQRLAEHELDQAIKDHKATGGTIIVVDPKTGQLLAMASRPTFDVTALDLSDDSKTALYRNRAITDTYEPGSVFKLVTASAAVDLGLVNPQTWWYDEGKVCLSGWCISNWDFSKNGSQNVQQILSKSLNTGAAWLAQLCGPNRFYDYVSRFGFGQPTGVSLSGEAGGRVRTPENDPDNWRPVDMATNSFGQGISVTPLQIAMMVSAIANDGLMMKPQIVKEIAYPGGSETVQPEQLRQVIAPETARTLRQMMGVVVDGVPKQYLDVKGYGVGGKTGTANIATDSGGYKPDAYISSFVGVAPLDNPAIAVLVKIDEPKDLPWGTVVAAPAFGRITQAALAYMKVAPSQEALVADMP